MSFTSVKWQWKMISYHWSSNGFCLWAVVRSMSGRKSLFMSCQPCLFWSSIALWLHLQIYNVFCLKRSGQLILKPSLRIWGNQFVSVTLLSEVLQYYNFAYFLFFLPPSLLCILHRDGKVHPLTFIHHTSTYQASMCKLMEYWLETNAYSLVNCVQHSVYSHYLSSDLQLKSCHKCSPGPLKRKRDSGIVQLQVCHLMIEDN